MPLCLIGMLLLFLGQCLGSRILIIPIQAKSHMLSLANLGEELADRNHDVYFLVRQGMSSPQVIESHSRMTAIRYGSPSKKENSMLQIAVDLFEGKGSKWRAFSRGQAFVKEECEALLLNNDEVHEQLAQLNLDLAIVEAPPMYKCGFVLPRVLNISYISYSDMLDPWATKLPWLPSMAPTSLSQMLYLPAQRMDFADRLVNTLVRVASSVIIPLLIEHQNMESVRAYSLQHPVHSIEELGANPLIWLYANDPLVSWHYPKMSHVVDVGGLSIRPLQPLPPDLETLVSAGHQGTILVSFGTVATHLPERLIQTMLDAFRRSYDQRFLWSFPKVSNIRSDVPDNVHLRDWVPQNEILAHQNLFLFISHCGRHSLYEAIYNGVPLLCVPVFGDQYQNAQMVVMKGYGQMLDIFSFTTEELYGAIHDILHDPSYRRRTQHASQIFHDRPETPRQVAARWVEHVLKYGDAHLKSHVLELSWWSYWLFDVTVVLM